MYPVPFLRIFNDIVLKKPLETKKFSNNLLRKSNSLACFLLKLDLNNEQLFLKLDHTFLSGFLGNIKLLKSLT